MKHPFAIVAGEVKRIDEIAEGDEPRCPVTGERLFPWAVGSSSVSAHFSYGPGSGGGGYGSGWGSDGETYWHALAKQIIGTSTSLRLPDGEILNYASAEVEVAVPGTTRRADALVLPENLFVEFSYSNPKGTAERADYRRARARCLEINIRSAGRRSMTAAELIDYVLHSASREWVFDMETAVREAWIEVLRRRAERARKRQEEVQRARRIADAAALEGLADAAELKAAGAISITGRMSFASSATSYRLAASKLRSGYLRAHNDALLAAHRAHTKAVEAEIYEGKVRAAMDAEREAHDAKDRALREAEIRAAAALEAWKKGEDEERSKQLALYAGKAVKARALADRHGGKVRDVILKGAECCERAAEELASWKRKTEARYWRDAAEAAGVEVRRLLREHAAAVAEAESETTMSGLRACVARMTDTVPADIAARLADLEAAQQERNERMRQEAEARRVAVAEKARLEREAAEEEARKEHQLQVAREFEEKRLREEQAAEEKATRAERIARAAVRQKEMWTDWLARGEAASDAQRKAEAAAAHQTIDVPAEVGELLF